MTTKSKSTTTRRRALDPREPSMRSTIRDAMHRQFVNEMAASSFPRLYTNTEATAVGEHYSKGISYRAMFQQRALRTLAQRGFPVVLLCTPAYAYACRWNGREWAVECNDGSTLCRQSLWGMRDMLDKLVVDNFIEWLDSFDEKQRYTGGDFAIVSEAEWSSFKRELNGGM